MTGDPTGILKAARDWVEDCEGDDAELLTDPQVRAYVRREHVGRWVTFLTLHATEDVLNVARAWIEDHPDHGINPDAEPIVIWTAILDRFPDGWDGFADHYGRMCDCGHLRESSEHSADGHPFQGRTPGGQP